jgi:hypothetical protein
MAGSGIIVIDTNYLYTGLGNILRQYLLNRCINFLIV